MARTKKTETKEPMTIREFTARIPGFTNKSYSQQCVFFVYYLTVILGKEVANPTEVINCFDAADLNRPSNPHHLMHLQAAKKGKKGGRLIKVDGDSGKGYRVFAQEQERIKEQINGGDGKQPNLNRLREIAEQIKSSPENIFANETIVCFANGANRATIVMAWNLAMGHIHERITADAATLSAFNQAIADSKNKRLHNLTIAARSDFEELPDSLCIDLARKARAITAEQRKILKQSLARRNSAAHPSQTKVSREVAAAFLMDILDNILTP